MKNLYFKDDNITLFLSDTFETLDRLVREQTTVQLIVSDPPYFLSNNGTTCKNGKLASVNKGKWDKVANSETVLSFHQKWIHNCLALLDETGSIWISTTQHSLFHIGHILQEEGCHVLNIITWEKPNPPPNLSCRYFTHSTEFLIWAKKNKSVKHKFNYQDMKKENGGKQMKTVWQFTPPLKSEKSFGKHPTQKPVKLMERIILASSSPGDTVLDPFAGSSTTGVAAIQHNRRYIGIEQEKKYIELSYNRLLNTRETINQASQVESG